MRALARRGTQERGAEITYADLRLDPVAHKVWRGDQAHEYGEAAVVGTTAIALKLLNKADTQESAYEMALDLWAQRNKSML